MNEEKAESERRLFQGRQKLSQEVAPQRMRDDLGRRSGWTHQEGVALSESVIVKINDVAGGRRQREGPGDKTPRK